jgi:hypothetical protein
MVEYARLRVYYIPLPWASPLESILNIINANASTINSISLRFGYRFTGATPPGAEAPCEFLSCFDMWFRKEGSPIPLVPLLAVIIGLAVTVGIVVVTTKWFERDIVVTETAKDIYDNCVKAGGDPNTCQGVLEKAREVAGPGLPGLFQQLSNLILIGVGGLIALEVIRYLRERRG